MSPERAKLFSSHFLRLSGHLLERHPQANRHTSELNPRRVLPVVESQTPPVPSRHTIGRKRSVRASMEWNSSMKALACVPMARRRPGISRE